MGTIVSVFRPFAVGGSWSQARVDHVLQDVVQTRFPALFSVSRAGTHWAITCATRSSAEHSVEWGLFLKGSTLQGKMPNRMTTAEEWVYWEVMNAVARRLEGQLTSDNGDGSWPPREAETFRQFWRRRYSHAPFVGLLLRILRSEHRYASPALRKFMSEKEVPVRPPNLEPES